uniref:Uncharacterized protein n=1 Tax=Cacopsylla melanoneura TaxID=428564 RepID=A0A8D8QEK0_9HEMI
MSPRRNKRQICPRKGISESQFKNQCKLHSKIVRQKMNLLPLSPKPTKRSKVRPRKNSYELKIVRYNFCPYQAPTIHPNNLRMCPEDRPGCPDSLFVFRPETKIIIRLCDRRINLRELRIRL